MLSLHWTKLVVGLLAALGPVLWLCIRDLNLGENIVGTRPVLSTKYVNGVLPALEEYHRFMHISTPKNRYIAFYKS